MLLSIFTKPLFINPQAYLIIPELASLHNYTPYDFDSTEYSFKVITSGKIEGELLKAKDDYILHLDLYSIDGNCVLGEFYLNNSQIDLNSFNLLQNGNIVTINFSSIPSPIASYRCYDKTNDDADRNILTDLTGNGHDIQLYNFAFAEGSGYGKYATDFINSFNYNKQDRWEANVTSNLITVTKVLSQNLAQLYCRISSQINIVVPSYKIEVTGLTNGQRIRYINTIEGEQIDILVIENDGIYTIPSITYIGNRGIYGFCIVNIQESCNITIEQIPEYKGALVSDGVDDYGLCENFPILTKEKGYTVCAIRNHINNKGTLVSKRTTSSSEGGDDQIGAFQVERYYGEQPSAFSFGIMTNLNSFSNDIFIFQKSNYYCNLPILVGGYKDYVDLTLFSYYKSSAVGSFALYALEIYDRDLTDEEIAKVKARMIAEYEEKTGNKYEEETA